MLLIIIFRNEAGNPLRQMREGFQLTAKSPDSHGLSPDTGSQMQLLREALLHQEKSSRTSGVGSSGHHVCMRALQSIVSKHLGSATTC